MCSVQKVEFKLGSSAKTIAYSSMSWHLFAFTSTTEWAIWEKNPPSWYTVCNFMLQFCDIVKFLEKRLRNCSKIKARHTELLCDIDRKIIQNALFPRSCPTCWFATLPTMVGYSASWLFCLQSKVWRLKTILCFTRKKQRLEMRSEN